MLFNRHAAPHRSRAALLVTLLLLTLAVAGVLAEQAYVAARSHEQVAERVLTDYVSAAAWEFVRVSRKDLDEALAHMLQPELCADRPPFDLKAPVDRSSPLAAHVTNYFRVNLADAAFDTRGAELDRVTQGALVRALRMHGRSLFVGTSQPGLVVIDDEEMHAPRLLAFVLQHDSAGDAGFGFEADVAFLKEVFDGVLRSAALLPPSLASSAESAKLLSVLVFDDRGRALYRSTAAGENSRFGTRLRMKEGAGGLWVKMFLSESAASTLVIGGLPRSRLPLLVGLLALTTVLVGVALVQLKREYELVRLRGTFVANVSHELRTPLAQIRMFGETLLLGRIRNAEEGRRSLEIIDQEARRLTQLVENVLLFSRSERGANRLAPERTDLAPLLRDVVEAFRPLAAARGATIAVDAPPDVSAPVDLSAMRQMILNLLDNAVKYGPPGQTITLAMRVHDDRVRISVEDQGPGIPDSAREDVWRPFWRLERERSSGVAGTGIGLSVVRELCELHGGRVWVESVDGGGARVLLELPHAEAHTWHEVADVDAQPLGVRM